MPRKPKYFQTEAGGRERWLISYTDIVTILLILFVSVAAQSMKARIVPPPTPPPKPIEQPPPALQQSAERLKQRGLDVHLEARGLVINLPQVILFPSGEDRIGPDADALLSQIADELRSIPNKVALVGHADRVPIHNNRFHNNWELSAARSLTLLTLLSTQFGIPESRLSIQSYGSNSPRNPGDSEEARAENRRVEMVILDAGGQ